MLIRRAVSADIPSLHRLLRQVLEVHHAGRPDLFRGGVTKYTDEELAVLLQDVRYSAPLTRRACCWGMPSAPLRNTAATTS